MKFIALAASVVLAMITAALAWLALSRASLPYENDRYYDPVDSVVYHDGAVAVYGLLAMVFAAATGIAAWGATRLWKKGRAGAGAE